MSEGFVKGARPICGFCNAPWTDDMVRLLDVYSSGGCDSCGYGARSIATVDITCAACDRLIYRKEHEGDFS
jgi:hypothetical protein